MSRYMIISDIHGSETATRKALEHFDRLDCEKLIVLGDILYHGPRNPLPAGHNPKGVVELLNARKDKIVAVRGNCEAEVDQMVLEFPCMSDYVLMVDQGKHIFLTHGHIYNPEHMPYLPDGSVFLYGHTHLWEKRVHDGILICNPGSIALPKQNRDATFAIYDNGNVDIVTL